MKKLEERTSCIIEPEPFRFSASGRNQLLTHSLTHCENDPQPQLDPPWMLQWATGMIR